MHRFNWTVLLPLLALFLISAPRASAQSAAFEGTFALAEQGSDNIGEAINGAIGDMNFVIRQVARGRLKKTNVPYRKISIAHSQDKITVTTDERDSVATPANGTPVKWKRGDGEVMQVSTEWENGKLEQTFRAEDGQRVNVYSLSGDGNILTMNVVITSPKLPDPLSYTLVYHRAG